MCEPRWRNWYTRMLEVHVPVRDWRFESSPGHLGRLVPMFAFGEIGIPTKAPGQSGIIIFHFLLMTVGRFTRHFWAASSVG